MFTNLRERLLAERATLIEYLKMKTEAEDFHAVADAAMDIREIDAKLSTLPTVKYPSLMQEPEKIWGPSELTIKTRED